MSAIMAVTEHDYIKDKKSLSFIRKKREDSSFQHFQIFHLHVALCMDEII